MAVYCFDHTEGTPTVASGELALAVQRPLHTNTVFRLFLHST